MIIPKGRSPPVDKEEKGTPDVRKSGFPTSHLADVMIGYLGNKSEYVYSNKN